MTKLERKEVFHANNMEAEGARKIAENLMRKYVIPKLSETPTGRIFFADTGWSWKMDDQLTTAIKVLGYFSSTEIKGYTSPFDGEPIEVGVDAGEEYDTVVRTKKATDLSEKVIRKMKAEKLEKIRENAFEEENLVAYNYDERRDPRTGITSFKVKFKFVS